MRQKIRDITGERFGKLIVVSLAGINARRSTVWKCRCDCGNEKIIVKNSLTSGHSRSCGCLHRRVNGEARNGHQTPEYHAWAGMKNRCFSKHNRKYREYGGRGITVCDKWKNSYAAFLADVGRKPSNHHSLDRINNDGNYEPGNVRWATAAVQQANRRKPKRWKWGLAGKYAYDVVRIFESTLADYSGAKYAVSVESCTSALFLACAYLKVKTVEIPKYTYNGVPMSIIHAGGKVKFNNEEWLGSYQLKPYPIYDCARHFTSGMYVPGSFMCISFHWAKHLPIGRGGAILCDDKDAVDWLRRARFDGRREGIMPKNDKGMILGWHMYFTPPQAAQGLMLMASIPEHNKPLPNSDYPDLSVMEIFQ